MSAGLSYEEQHNRFVTSDNGCSPIEILQVLVSISIMPFLASLTIPWVVPSSFTKMTAQNPRAFAIVKAVVEYPFVLLSPIFFITIFAGKGVEESSDDSNELLLPLSPCATVAVIAMCIGIITVNHAITRPIWNGIQMEWNKIKEKSMKWTDLKFSLQKEMVSLPGEGTKNHGVKLPFVTNYRGIVTFLTVLAILAVDLVIFPRRFAKTKTFGFSIMDIGTGSFVFANGIVALEARNLRSNLKKSLKSSVPLLALGAIRLVTLKGIRYPEVAEEYGVHWNFFFTLAAVKILSSVLFSVVSPRSCLKIACFVGIFNEIIITRSGFQESFILNPDISRTSGWIAANREGIFSIPGYLTIYVASVYIGQLIFSSARCRRTLQDWAYYGVQSGSQLLILWSLTFLSHFYGSPVCRRSGNLSYTLWALAINYTMLWLQFGLCFLQVVIQQLGLLHGPLLFFELRQSNLKKLQDLAKSKEEKSKEEQAAAAEAEGLEATLNLLAQKLDKIQDEAKRRKKPEEKKELDEFTKEVEKEMETVGAKCLAEELKRVGGEMIANSSVRDLVELPDLTRTPIVLEAICFNGLGVFLLGNLLTGVVNSTLYSMYLPGSTGLLILWTYASIVGFSSFLLYWLNVQIKFW